MKRLDAAITRFVQNWIADPLQWSGVKLERQVQLSVILSFLGWIGVAYFDVALRNWWGVGFDGLVVPAALASVVYGLGPEEKLATSKSLFRLVWLAFFLQDSTVSILGMTSNRRTVFMCVTLGLTLRGYLLACKPKPPAGSMKFVPESA